MKTTSFSNCFKQLSLAWQFASISSPAGVSLNTSNQDHGEKNNRYQIFIFNVLNVGFVAGLIGLVPVHLPQSHSLQYAHPWSAVAVVLPLSFNALARGEPFQISGSFFYPEN